jgi:hypothetical protein
MPDDGLRLNSLSRYSKQSSNYVLEVHDHCEVPAGCGGVVLRWRNPHRSIPLAIWVYTAGEAEILLDGAPPTSGRPLVPYGEHTLTWQITGFDAAAPVLACAVHYDDAELHIRVNPPTGQRVSIATATDGTWRYTLTPPPGAWTRPDFEASAWPSMVERPVSEEERRHDYRLNHACNLGAQPLGVEGVGHTVWIRRAFSVTEAQQEAEATDA